MNQLTTISLTLSAAAALTVIGASTAAAHSGRLTASTACVDGGWQVTWSAHNAQVDQSMTADGFGTIAPGADGTRVDMLTLSQPSMTLAGYFTFADFYTDPFSLTVVQPEGCVSVPTTTPAPSTVTATTTTVTFDPPATTAPVIAPRTSALVIIPPVTVTGNNVEAPVLPATGSHTLELTALGAGLAGAGNWMRRWSNRKAAE